MGWRTVLASAQHQADKEGEEEHNALSLFHFSPSFKPLLFIMRFFLTSPLSFTVYIFLSVYLSISFPSSVHLSSLFFSLCPFLFPFLSIFQALSFSCWVFETSPFVFLPSVCLSVSFFFPFSLSFKPLLCFTWCGFLLCLSPLKEGGKVSE